MRKLLILFVCLAAAICVAQKGKKDKAKTSAPIADSLYAAKQFASAVPMYESLLKDAANKSNAAMWNKLALSHYNLASYAQAIKAFDEVYKINPRMPGIFLNRAKAYSALNDVSSSLRMLDSAVVVGRFANYTMLENDPAFENLRKDERYKPLYNRLLSIAYPCSNLPEARQFDFWLGDWDVFQTANPSVKTGFNRITKQSGGCVILESWESVGPHQGMSINYYDPVDKTWKQKWAGSGQDITEFYDGKFENNAMTFAYKSPNPDGSFSKGRLTFTNLAPDKVRQHSEVSRDNGTTWQTVYDFTYIRR